MAGVGATQIIIGSTNSSTWDIKQPLAIYATSLDAVAQGEGLASVQFKGTYDYLVESPGQGIAIFTLGLDDSGASEMRLFGEAGLAKLVDATLQKLITLDQVKSGSYEVRILELPGFFSPGATSLLWLKSETASPDLICLPDQGFVPDTLQAGKAYTADEFFRLLQPIAQDIAQRRLRFQAGE
jgi:hypothetical protein